MIWVVYNLDCFYTCSVEIVVAYRDEADAKAYVHEHPGTDYAGVTLEGEDPE